MHAQAGHRHAGPFKFVRHDAGIEQADDLAGNPAAVSVGNDVDEVSLGSPGFEISDEMTDFDQRRHVVQHP